MKLTYVPWRDLPSRAGAAGLGSKFCTYPGSSADRKPRALAEASSVAHNVKALSRCGWEEVAPGSGLAYVHHQHWWLAALSVHDYPIVVHSPCPNMTKL